MTHSLLDFIGFIESTQYQALDGVNVNSVNYFRNGLRLGSGNSDSIKAAIFDVANATNSLIGIFSTKPPQTPLNGSGTVEFVTKYSRCLSPSGLSYIADMDRLCTNIIRTTL